jgi:aminopeptidase N
MLLRPLRAVSAALPLLAWGCGPLRPASPAPAAPVSLEAGVSLELARHRAATLGAVEYDLRLDLTGTERVPGTVTVSVQRGAGAGDLVLDYRGPALHEVQANGREVPDYLWRQGKVVIPARHLQAGPNTVHLAFTSAMAAAGTSIIRFAEPAEGPEQRRDTYLYTLLVPADANQLFPGFDQPDLKAVFRMELLAPPQWLVLANGALLERAPLAEGVRWRFAPTEPISTYLAAFAAGPWETWTEAAAPAGAEPITLYARRSRAQEVDADTQIAINRRALQWLEEYFRMPYPFAKYDMLLAPAFPFGGMEHPGAVFYNESRFIFREPPTLTERLGRSATIYHEVAHQWFGDLVTMEWFDDLWLKEGFSTYVAAKMQESLNPGTGAWKTFHLRNKPLAYGVDVTRGTTPVWQALENLDLAKSAYGPIVYNKAPSILKQLEHRVGEEAFREGLGILLRRHAYANMTWRDLLRALEESSGTSLADFGEHYILRPGVPVVEPVLEAEDGKITRLVLRQRPAIELPGGGSGWWPGRVQVRLGYRHDEDRVLPVAFSGHDTEVEAARGLPAPAFVFANEGDHGYGIFLLDPRSEEYLARHVGTLEDDLLRAMVWGAFWNLVGEARMPAGRFLETAMRELPAEADEQIAAHVLGRATTALQEYVSPAERARLQAPFERLLIARMDDPALPYGLRKASLDALLEVARTPAALGVLRELLAESRHFDGEPLRQPSRWAAVQTLMALDAPDAGALFRAERARDTGPEAERRAFVAGAAVPTAANKAEYFRRYFEDPELNEEWVTASLGMFNHPEHAALTLPFLRPALDRLPWIQENRRIFFLPQWVNSFVSGQRSAEALAVIDSFLARHDDFPADLQRKILQPRDLLERTVRVRERGGRP